MEPVKKVSFIGDAGTRHVLQLLEKESPLLEQKRRIEEKERQKALEEEEKWEDEIRYVNKDTIIFKASSIPSQLGASLTSTGIDFDESKHARIQKLKKQQIVQITEKGYVTINTTLGALNLELHCDLVPKTCDNFIQLCKTGYYDGTVFHRLIPKFMIQGGDPTGTGRGGESIWKHKFEDEFYPSLSHSGMGIVSMANSGPNTNGSQFFITFSSCTHLDRKHSIFGRVVGGLSVLKQMEQIPTDKSTNRPLTAIVIVNTVVYADPFENIRKNWEEQRETEKKKKKKKEKGENIDDESSLLSENIKRKRSVLEREEIEAKEGKKTKVDKPTGEKKILTSLKEESQQASSSGENKIGKYLPESILKRIAKNK
ncbi:peptidyl-prolyl cis-trans isomerase-like 2 [Monocercomonoides exilis]|uniref:peptidyl-prolyl cis-trans isomerase-like 2 n=1 Tax=Monocercomonoides exilis TaxID=2049356 RepID=UPI003559B8D8|nr:peptidyl-prolyl cis-trans isomerase-like 2 [Monocercomonoides exilis]|eukprot:MONOS_10832.1-p1 / transcript=MONOS_10832.1 / gene=MONOS_10832 / organism=Monocercomonoides_exilis_PA203 / gene_product=peptidyl-prolyl cis-trans isomerase-like 2 / transcript_product=peptidyl-prolyl cis-trans isomerase-like 2 / location=Mono_scaffold00509:7366-8772(+) / protein_length=370 / sequence_SO=supercontig / SO=protein_coding / is_pseudo=false